MRFVRTRETVAHENNERKSIEHGHLRVVRTNEAKSTYKRTSYYIIRSAVTYGHIHLLRYLEEHDGLRSIDGSYLELQMIRVAVRAGHLNIIQFVRQRSTRDRVICAEIIGGAITHAKMEILEFMRRDLGSHFDAHIDGSMIFSIGRYGSMDLDTLKFVEDHCGGVRFDDRYNLLARRAGGNGHLDILCYIQDKPGVRFDNTDIIQRAAERGHLHVLRWLHERHGVRLDAYDNLAMIMAAEYGHLHVLEYLKGKPGVRFDAENNSAIRKAIENGYHRVVRFLRLEGVLRIVPSWLNGTQEVK